MNNFLFKNLKKRKEKERERTEGYDSGCYF